MLKELFRPPYQQIKELEALIGLDNHIIPVENLKEANEKIVTIVNSLQEASRYQENENLLEVNVFCDFDGVIRPRLVRGLSFEEKIANLRVLIRLVQTADYFTLWSSRIVVDTDGPWGRINQLIEDLIGNSGAVSRFPIFTSRSQRRLFHFLYRNNPECDIKFNISPKKINGRDSFVEKAIDILEQGQSLFIIGSSLFDRIRIRKIIKLCQQNGTDLLRNFYYLDTGKWIY